MESTRQSAKKAYCKLSVPFHSRALSVQVG